MISSRTGEDDFPVLSHFLRYKALFRVYNRSMEELSKNIVELIGGPDNIISVVNCMTRLRFTVQDEGAVLGDRLKALPGVLGVFRSQDGSVEVVVGPGKSKKCMELIRAMGIGETAPGKQKEKAGNKVGEKAGEREFRRLSGIFGRIFAPLIPGIIVSGLCAGIASLITQVVPGYSEMPAVLLVFNLLSGIHAAFMTYLSAWAGYRAAEVFGGTPVLGGMMGLFTTLEQVNVIAKAAGLYNEAEPLSSILRTGRGGLMAALIGVYLMCRIESWIRRRIPDALDTTFTPFLTLLASLIPYVFLIMPAIGLVSSVLCKCIGFIALNPHPVVRMAAGYLGAALFLPMVALGMHHGLIALYAVQLETFGYVTLYPALAMAGAGQVGAAAAIAAKAKRTGNQRLCRVINAAMPAALMGVGEPLIYGVTLPMGRPFITAGLGAGFGGAFVMLMQVASTTWGPSGLLGVFVMTEGPRGAFVSAACYLAGLVMSCAAAYVLTSLMVSDDAAAKA